MLPSAKYRHVILAALLAVTIFPSRPSLAESFVAASEQRFQLEFDTVDGHFSVWSLEGLQSANAVRATISVERFGTHERWVPFLRVEIKNVKAAPNLYWGLVAGGKKGGGPLAFQALQRDAGKEIQKVDFRKTGNLKGKIALEISWATPGKLLIRLDNETQELRLPSTPTSL